MPEEYSYVYDPEHRKHPGNGYVKTKDGWSKGGKGHGSSPEPDSDPALARKAEISRNLFTEEEMTRPKTFNKVSGEEDFYRQADAAQDMMIRGLDNGREREWLGRNARHETKMTEESLMKPGPILFTAPVKSRKRAEEKVRVDFGGDWGKLKDGVRCSVAVDSFDDLPKAIEGFKKSGFKISGPVKNRFKNRLKSGYGDVLCNVDFGNGFIGEVQFHLKEMLRAKQFGGGHKLYEFERSLNAKYGNDASKFSDEDKTAMKECIMSQQRIYNKAYDSIRVKTASRGVEATSKNLPRYMLSDSEFSYYKYGDDDAVAYCYRDSHPKFWNGRKWKEVSSFLRFCDKAVEIGIGEFKKMAAKQGIRFK